MQISVTYTTFCFKSLFWCNHHSDFALKASSDFRSAQITKLIYIYNEFKSEPNTQEYGKCSLLINFLNMEVPSHRYSLNIVSSSIQIVKIGTIYFVEMCKSNNNQFSIRQVRFCRNSFHEERFLFMNGCFINYSTIMQFTYNL